MDNAGQQLLECFRSDSVAASTGWAVEVVVDVTKETAAKGYQKDGWNRRRCAMDKLVLWANSDVAPAKKQDSLVVAALLTQL